MVMVINILYLREIGSIRNTNKETLLGILT